MGEDVSLTVGGADIAGWTDVRITRRIEACPNDFDIGMTELLPDDPGGVIVQAGDPIVVSIGGEKVITGYLNRYARGYDAGDHHVDISGRGKTQDLVDSSAEQPGGQFKQTTVLQLANDLGSHYGITASAPDGAGPQIPQLNLTVGETAFEVIERVARYAGYLAYEDVDGNLVLARAGGVKAASGAAEGANVISAEVVSDDSQRFSDYVCALSSTALLDSLAPGGSESDFYFTVKDPNVKRHRLLYFIAEAARGGFDICKVRANWEMARRAGRGFNARVVVDSWRDAAGVLWTPNTLAPLDLPKLKLEGVTWTIGEVTYHRGMGGETAELLMMDPSAFVPEPILLLPTHADILPNATPP